MKYLIPLLVILCLLNACHKAENWQTPVKEMTDEQYPDNPNLTSRHPKAQQILYKTIAIQQQVDDKFDFELLPQKNETPTIKIKGIPLLEWMPTAVDWIKKDDYLTYIGLINQEWNRQQVQFNAGQFEVTAGTEVQISRVDLARNCLNAYLWEMLVYAKDTDGKDKLYWQCWFDFPKDLYEELFVKRNKLSMDPYRAGLENWVDPPSKKINLGLLREVKSEKVVPFVSSNDEMYALKGELERKRKNIIYPKKVTKMGDLLSDSTRFATFAQPGFYDTKDPRVTYLSRFGKLTKVIERQITTPTKETALEIEYVFVSNQDAKTITRLVVGGLKPASLPVLSLTNASDGARASMGISNHSFYETFDYQQQHLTKDNPFYSFLLDEKGNFLDNHKIGIDGTVFHLDEEDNTKLHLWILAFERHAFVSHCIIKLSNR
ncbi:hypothetical protein [Runella limosa]|uniref:hypothetical protein n=1 Tax=Runella limosa TaxID=370978 RepID=UPI000406AA20|nr:hypothetical protein [Runella limosa]